MSDPPKVAAAQIEVERTKAALLDTANELLERFQPHNLVDDLWEQAKIKGADLAEDAVDAVKKRPVAVGGVVAALTMFLAREPIKDVATSLFDAMTSSKKEPKRKAAALKPKESKSKAKELTSKERPAPPPARRRARPPVRTPTKADKTEKAT